MSWIEDTTPTCDESQVTCPKYGIFQGGYFGYTPWSFVTITLFNAVVSFALIIIGLPLFLILGAAVKLRDGGPVLYKGVRLGLSKNPFYMYKFRTLPVGSQKRIGGEVLSHKHMTLPPFSRFLRDTRLDELPQLFNILRGDMDFIGPRPIRPEVYEQQARDIRDFDMRFAVRPGLIGYAQLFTPHSTPKRLRAHIDNKFVLRRRSRIWDIFVILYTISVVARDVALKGGRLVWREVFARRLLRLYRESRALERAHPSAARVRVVANPHVHGPGFTGELRDINEVCFRMHSSDELDGDGPFVFRIERHIQRGRRKRYKRALVTGTVQSRPAPTGGARHAYVIRYEAATPLNAYLLDQYFLGKSMV
ncbi:lipopolysaccharide/colanic/teichoic acid biosynthesis glycosyltransferase [Desulfobaculum xiamenense]|uniref:Lipopolysaccharide/colanic/teichoic acid biosynthesis glycosyltransferase n=1 Tax=Desulfobaculum xiamenense TaxID=995050 RepID=A0A846QQH3_9BACT|nr:sugar transferase [Desulfobaculum xiamenense]NJB67645.1 lipopolysaccharide/colanic/teichoic acid biosynthesis glycosyltransferase [Desulfobaculum xiamenense]